MSWKSKEITCHFCGYTWDPKNRHFVCPQCHTTYNPTKSSAVGFAGEVIVARRRTNMTRVELAQVIGCSVFTLRSIERGLEPKNRNTKSRIIREKVRIWIESTKPPIDRRKEIDNMFKEAENG